MQKAEKWVLKIKTHAEHFKNLDIHISTYAIYAYATTVWQFIRLPKLWVGLLFMYQNKTEPNTKTNVLACSG